LGQPGEPSTPFFWRILFNSILGGQLRPFFWQKKKLRPYILPFSSSSSEDQVRGDTKGPKGGANQPSFLKKKTGQNHLWKTSRIKSHLEPVERGDHRGRGGKKKGERRGLDIKEKKRHRASLLSPPGDEQ